MKDRHLELSSKLMEMGRALMKEGKETHDFSVTQTGTNLIMVGSLLLDESNLILFGQMCGLFSAKMIIDNMENNNHEYINYLKQKSDKESYEDFIKRINKLREDNGHTPIE